MAAPLDVGQAPHTWGRRVGTRTQPLRIQKPNPITQAQVLHWAPQTQLLEFLEDENRLGAAPLAASSGPSLGPLLELRNVYLVLLEEMQHLGHISIHFLVWLGAKRKSGSHSRGFKDVRGLRG